MCDYSTACCSFRGNIFHFSKKDGGAATTVLIGFPAFRACMETGNATHRLQLQIPVTMPQSKSCLSQPPTEH